MERAKLTYDELLNEADELRYQLEEATDTIEAIRTGQVDALIVQGDSGHQLYTLKTADQTYRMFIEKMNEGAVTLNKEGLILYSNSRFAEMLNMPLEKVIGLSFNIFILPDHKVKFDALIKAAWQAECKEEVDLLSKNNGPVHCLLSCNTLELDEGTALSLILTDLTIQKDTEKQLKLRNEQLAEAQSATEKLNDELEDTVRDRTVDLVISREHFKLLANNIPQMTWTNQPDGQVDFYNSQWYNYTGLDLHAINNSWQLVTHPDDLMLTNEKFDHALQTGEVFEVENRYKRADGTYRWHLNRAVPLRDEAGKILFWVGTATDIEDQKKEIEKKDEFIGIASHELKTPLTSLKGYLQLIGLKKESLPNGVKQYLDKSIGSLNKLQRLVNDLLDVSKIQAGRLEYAMHPVNLTELVRGCTENVRHVYPGYNFENHAEAGLVVNGNEERLEQVLMNLINNAVKYSPVNKNIVIDAAKHNDHIRVSVADNGIGLSAGQKGKIFERFYRVEDKKYMSSGLGMGLYISQEIIKNHHGLIGVDSELGKGSTFYFDLPAI
ncbi:MAG: Alkaline phosphatase synthesis sensor protein PhoR [Mucilaginibacter sp.]|uniref:PAS domain-containing sensor histidine kinase n=1 Tax=Mucilaginibacter sp. TaxID=1882438 RepID=UPI0026301B03|nr:ATP-binding protein [Mucilaginibacter sp.]MDB5003127.1 Alkaline phosphatase synthesis sensor protein PhoR [Mucilaginibacter sp.]